MFFICFLEQPRSVSEVGWSVGLGMKRECLKNTNYNSDQCNCHCQYSHPIGSSCMLNSVTKLEVLQIRKIRLSSKNPFLL
jgi:hypothetical protein